MSTAGAGKSSGMPKPTVWPLVAAAVLVFAVVALVTMFLQALEVHV